MGNFKYNDKTIGFYYEKLDYTNVKGSENRLNLVSELVKDDGFFVEYFEKYYNPILGTWNDQVDPRKIKPLSENDDVCRVLEAMATYMISEAEREERKDEENDAVKFPTITEHKEKRNNTSENSDIDLIVLNGDVNNKKKIGEFEKKEKIKRETITQNRNSVKRKYSNESKFPHFLVVKSHIPIGKNIDFSDITVSKETRLETEQKLLDTRRNIRFDLKNIRKIINSCDDGKLKLKLRKIVGTMNSNEEIVEDAIYREINFKSPLVGSEECMFDHFEFTNINHLKLFIKEYYKHSRDNTDPNGTLSSIIITFNELFEKTELSNVEREIAYMYMVENRPITDKRSKKFSCETVDGDCKNGAILDIIKEKYGSKKYSHHTHISAFINNKLPEKMLQAYKDSLEEWVYTHKIAGSYKKCVTCKENKLALKKYYGSDSRKLDGLKSVCKSCDKK